MSEEIDCCPPHYIPPPTRIGIAPCQRMAPPAPVVIAARCRVGTHLVPRDKKKEYAKEGKKNVR